MNTVDETVKCQPDGHLNGHAAVHAKEAADIVIPEIPDTGDAPAQRLSREKKKALIDELARMTALDFALVQREYAKQLELSQAGLVKAVSERRKELKRQAAEEAVRAAVAADERRGIAWPERTGDGGVKNRSQKNIQAFFLRASMKLVLNEMSWRGFVHRDGEVSSLTNEMASSLWLEADSLGLQASKEYFIEVLENEARKNAFHPVRQYLDSLEWDGIERLDGWLHTFMDAEDTELNRAFARKTLIGAVRRVRQPGAKHDTVLVLIGRQGRGKSSAIAALCFDEELFTDSLCIGDDEKKVIEQTGGKWIAELAELAGMGKRDSNTAKAMISRKVDRSRLSFGRLTSERPRQFILFGTVNEEQFLRDPTGNRRYWPVKISGKLDPDEMCAHIIRTRDQLWAEAAYYEARGEGSTLPKQLWAAAAESQRRHVITDAWQEHLEPYMEGKHFVVTSDVYDYLGLTLLQRDPRVTKRVAEILTGMGYERKQRWFKEGAKWGYERVD